MAIITLVTANPMDWRVFMIRNPSVRMLAVLAVGSLLGYLAASSTCSSSARESGIEGRES
jgi:hypothetical protein